MPFWSGQKLRTQLGSYVSNFNKDKVDCAAYTLAMGEEYFVTHGDRKFDSKEVTIKKLSPNEAFPIPPGQFAFLLTKEKVTVPATALAFISIKFSLKRQGIVNVSGFHVDPGWKGKLMFAVYNAGPSPVHLREGEGIFLIWYADLDDSAITDDAKNGQVIEHIDPQWVTTLSGHMYSPMSLIADIQQIREQLAHHAAIRTTLISVAGIVLGIILSIIGVAVPIGKSLLNERFTNIEDRVDNLEKTSHKARPDYPIIVNVDGANEQTHKPDIKPKDKNNGTH